MHGMQNVKFIEDNQIPHKSPQWASVSSIIDASRSHPTHHTQ